MLQIENIKVYDLFESMKASGYSMTGPEFMEYDDDISEKVLNRCKRLSSMSAGSGHQNFLKGIRVSFDIRYPQYWSMEAQRYNFLDIVTSGSKMHSILKMDLRSCVNKYVCNGTIRNVETLVRHYNAVVKAYEGGDKEEIFLKNAAYKLYCGRAHPECQYNGETLAEFKYDCFMRIISNCPMGLELVMRCSTNYLQLQTIYRQRKGHILKEDWGAFCRFIEELPFAHTLIIGD